MSDTKQHIMKTALFLFAQSSYKDVTMKDIVEKTGLSKGAVYHYFTSKEQLFQETVEYMFFEKFFTEFEKVKHDSLHDFLKSYGEISIEFMNGLENELGELDQERTVNVYMLLFEALAHSPGFREKALEQTKREHKAWVQAVATARESGEIKSGMSDEQIASMFIFMGDGIGLRAILEGSVKATFFDKVSQYWEMFYQEIKT